MTRTYICSACGQEMRGYKDQCPYCKVSGDNLVESNWGHSYEDEDFFDYEQGYDNLE